MRIKYRYQQDATLDTYKVPGDIYLNTHGFHYIGKASYKPGWENGKTYYHDYGAYISKDESIITTWHEDKNRLGNIYFVKPGPKTDKGIEVGMNVSDIEKNMAKYSLHRKSKLVVLPIEISVSLTTMQVNTSIFHVPQAITLAIKKSNLSAIPTKDYPS